MSRTDKTRPWWIQEADPITRRRLHLRLKVWHFHFGAFYREHGCVERLDMPAPRREGPRGCRVGIRYADYEKLYPRPRWRRKHMGRDGAARAALRQLAHGWVKCLPEDRDNIDSSKSCPSRRWLWRNWYWD
jgi:hypothetical protein